MSDLTDLNLDFLPADRQGIYLVGGTVRDLIRGQQPSDIDLAVSGDIDRVAASVARKCRGRVVNLGKKGFAVLRVAAPTLTVDITPLEGRTIEDDLCLRDFTINALAFDIKTKRVVDPTGGLMDLRQKTVRMVSEAAFTKDPARLVRAYRMAASFGFDIAPGTRAAIGRCTHLIGGVAGERIWAELLKLFQAPTAAAVIRDMAADGLLAAIFPELAPTIGCVQNSSHQFDVFEHSLRTVEQIELLLAEAGKRFGQQVPAAEIADLVGHTALLKYAALLHDIGKPATRKVDADGRTRFPGHAAQGAVMAEAISRRLRLSNAQRETATAVIRHHIRPLFLFLARKNGTLRPRGTIRFFKHCSPHVFPIIAHSMADIMAKNRRTSPRDAEFIRFGYRLLADYGQFYNRQENIPPLITGHDLITVFGLFPAPRFKRILNQVDERRLSGALSTREEALEWVRSHLESQWGENGCESEKKTGKVMR